METYKKLILTIALLVAAIALADRTDIWSAASASVYHVELTRLPDGGCSVGAWGTYSKQDGGVAPGTGSGFVEVSGANQTTCLDLLNTKGPLIFKAALGL